MKTIQAVYERGVLRPRKKLPLREHCQVTLIVQVNDPIQRTRGAFRIPKRKAKVLIYDNTLLES